MNKCACGGSALLIRRRQFVTVLGGTNTVALGSASAPPMSRIRLHVHQARAHPVDLYGPKQRFARLEGPLISERASMRFVPALALLLATAPAQAQDPANDPSCANVRVAIPVELTGWSQQAPVAAGTEAGGGATIRPGQAVLASLHPAQHLKLTPAPEKVGPNGGTLTLVVAEAGTYRVAVGQRAWVDLIRDGKVTSSSAHGHGPKCTGIRKMVDFVLSPGNYTLQLSGSEAESVAVLAVKIA